MTVPVSPSPVSHILVVEDDCSVRDAVAEFLSMQGYLVSVAEDGIAADRALASKVHDLVILDLMLPGETGLSICRRLTAAGLAVLVMSALGSTDDRVTGLNEGAADYLPKPFEPRELLARVKAVIRRNSGQRADKSSEYQFDGLRFVPSDGLLSDSEGNLIALTAGELRLLDAFLQRPGRLLSREMLLDLTHGDDAGPYDRAVDLAVSRLRRKLVDAGAPRPFQTVRGLGYRFIAAVTVA